MCYAAYDTSRDLGLCLLLDKYSGSGGCDMLQAVRLKAPHSVRGYPFAREF